MKSRQGIFVGYSDTVKGFRIFYEKENKVQIEREIIFTPQDVKKRIVYLGLQKPESSGDDNVKEMVEETQNSQGGQVSIEEQDENIRNLPNNLSHGEEVSVEEQDENLGNIRNNLTTFQVRNDQRLRPAQVLKRPQHLSEDF